MVMRRRRRVRQEHQRAARRWWVKPWVLAREVHSQYANLFEELDLEFDMDYRAYVRMDRNLFSEILERVGPRITKNPR